MHAFVIVDVQAEFPVPREIVERIRERSAAFPLRVFTQFVNPPGSLFRRKFNRTLCSPGSPGTRLLIEPGPDDLRFEKSGYGLSPQQIQELKAHSVTEATVCGIDTDACVLGVMFSLWDQGIDCHPQPDLCWSSTGLHDAAVKIAKAQFGD
ncbi:hypothetical protein DB347_13990 [Opitutaceae bacterium EW11]|nr:hypothetical protein DB347_13990 [Opitutaceae bacterium EW11]